MRRCRKHLTKECSIIIDWEGKNIWGSQWTGITSKEKYKFPCQVMMQNHSTDSMIKTKNTKLIIPTCSPKIGPENPICTRTRLFHPLVIALSTVAAEQAVPMQQTMGWWKQFLDYAPMTWSLPYTVMPSTSVNQKHAVRLYVTFSSQMITNIRKQ